MFCQHLNKYILKARLCEAFNSFEVVLLPENVNFKNYLVKVKNLCLVLHLKRFNANFFQLCHENLGKKHVFAQVLSLIT